MKRRTGLCILLLAGAWVARPARAAGPDPPGLDPAEIITSARPGVVLLRTATGVCSGVLLNDQLVATSKERLRAAGTIGVFAFLPVKTEDGREIIERQEVGRAEVLRLHRSADAALLGLVVEGSPRGLDPLPAAPGFPRAGADVAVCGVPGAVRLEDARDLDIRAGGVLEGAASAEGALPLEAPVNANSSGGAVLDAQGRLAGVASRLAPRGAPGGAVPMARVEELRSGAAHALSAAEAAAHVAKASGPPSHFELSPGSPEGKRASIGQGAFAIKESRAVLASAVFIRDQHDALEYVACPIKGGKLHETVIATDADPTTLNFGLMMLGYRAGGGVEELGDTRVPLGDRLVMYVEWDWNEEVAIRRYLAGIDPPWDRPQWKEVLEKVREGAIRWEPGPKVRARIEDFVFDRVAGRPMERTYWAYTGSLFGRDEDTNRRYFEATVNGVFAAVYRDPSAVLNNPLKGGEDDTYYCVDDTMVPPRGTRCTLVMLPARPAEARPEE